jgi:hypothetical protein
MIAAVHAVHQAAAVAAVHEEEIVPHLHAVKAMDVQAERKAVLRPAHAGADRNYFLKGTEIKNPFQYFFPQGFYSAVFFWSG